MADAAAMFAEMQRWLVERKAKCDDAGTADTVSAVYGDVLDKLDEIVRGSIARPAAISDDRISYLQYDTPVERKMVQNDALPPIAAGLLTDGPDTELAAAIAWFREDPKRLDFAPITEWSRHLRTIVRACLARPAAGRDLTEQDIHDEAMAVDAAAEEGDDGPTLRSRLADRLNGIARPAVARTDGQPPADKMADALRLIAGDRCSTYTRGRCSDEGSGRTRGAQYGADAWCDACVAHDALSTTPAELEGQALVDALVAAGWTRTGGQAGRYARLKRDVPVSNTALVPLDRGASDYADLLSLAREEIGTLPAAPADDTAAPAGWPDDIGAVLRDLRDDLTAFRVQCRDDGEVLRAVGLGDALDMLTSRIARHPRRAGHPVRDSQDGGA